MTAEAKKHVDHIRSLQQRGLISMEVLLLHNRFVHSRFFETDEWERAELMVKKGWGTFPCWEMFPPEGTIEVWDEKEVV